MNLQGNSGHVDRYGKHAVRARRRAPVLGVAGQCVPSGCVAAPGVVRGNVSAPGSVPRSSRQAAVHLVLIDAKDETRRQGGREREKTAEDRGTGLVYNILTPAKRPSRDITTAMRTALPAAHARDGIALYIRPTAAGDGDGKADRRRKKRLRMREPRIRGEEARRRETKRGIKRAVRRANSVRLPT